MAEQQSTAPAPAPAPDGGAAPPALELPGGEPAGNTDPNPQADPPAGAPAPAPADPPAGGDPADPNAEPPAARARFEEVTKRARQYEQQARESERRLQTALSALERATSAPPAAAPAQEQEPTPPVFETPEQYQRDMAQYARDLAVLTAKRQVQAERAEAERLRVEGEQTAYQQKVRETFTQRRAAAIAEMPDYTEVAESDDVRITVPMAHAITLSEHGPKIAYFLGKNPAEADRIAKLPEPGLQIFELGMLAARVTAPKPPARTNAPAPIRPLGGGATTASKSLDDMSMEEYAAHRSKR